VIEDPISTDIWNKLVNMGDDNEKLEALQAVSQAFLKVGITTAHTKEKLQDVILIMKNLESVPVRIKPMLFFYPLKAENIDEVIGAGILRGKKCIATYADGSIEGHTAAMYEPYTDDKTTLGMLYYTDEEMYDFVEKAHKAGIQISIHAESDRSIDQVLWAYEKVLEKYPSKDHRHRIEHFEIATPKQINRVAKSGIALAMQPMFIPACEGPNLDYYRSLLGDERVKRAHTYRAILNEEILVSGGSDSPVTKMNPIGGIHALVNHPLKEQRIDINEAIEIFTINGAKIGFEEDLKGSIEPGKLADFVVLSEDPYLVPPDTICDIRVEMTIIDGNVVYERKLL
jgi:predicted amidohydrolase YtcJ